MSNTISTGKPVSIEKEAVAYLKFPDAEVLSSKEDVNVRSASLDRALKLGNLEKNKIKITFEDNENMKQVNTTVWGVTDSRVILKKGVVIPINRIHHID